MTMDNREIVRLLGMGITWEGIQREAEERGLEYQRPCCKDCGKELTIGEVVRDATYCYSCEKRPRAAEASEAQELLSGEVERTALQGLAVAGRLLPVPWLVGGAVLIAAGFQLVRSLRNRGSQSCSTRASDGA